MDIWSIDLCINRLLVDSQSIENWEVDFFLDTFSFKLADEVDYFNSN